MAGATLIYDDVALTVPVDAFRLDGFVRWMRSSGFANGHRASFLGGNVHVEMNADKAVSIPADAFSLEGFLRWVHSPDFPERARPLFVNGEVSLDMSAEELLTHNFLKTDVNRDMGVWVARRDLGRLCSDGALLINDDAGLSAVPDLMFCLRASLKAGRVRWAEVVEESGRYIEVRGSPDLVVEIMSDSSVRKDTQTLPPAYFAAGVHEYWLIDARRNRLNFQIFARGRRKFVLVKPDSKGYRRSHVLGGSFRLVRKEDPDTGSHYRLLGK
jgi:Uma2 family endonuclease